MKVLEIDLNELVSKQITEQIDRLKNKVKSTENLLHKSKVEKEKLEKTIEDSKETFQLFSRLKKTFSNLTAVQKTSSTSYRSKHYSQFIFIENILLNIFNIKKERNGWYCYGSDGTLKAHLAVNYYSNKEAVVQLLKILIEDYKEIVTFIENFKMPFDYSKEQVIEFVKNPKTNTNESEFEISEFWVRNLAGTTNMPYNLIMENPFILEEGVFTLLLESIKKRVNNHYYLFALPKHNKNISKEQIASMGELLLTLNPTYLSYDKVKEFISDNINSFNNSTLDFLYDKVSSDNQFKTLHWEKFPVKYQMKFLKSKPLDEVLKLLTNYSCSWSNENKTEFLKTYLNN